MVNQYDSKLNSKREICYEKIKNDDYRKDKEIKEPKEGLNKRGSNNETTKKIQSGANLQQTVDIKELYMFYSRRVMISNNYQHYICYKTTTKRKTEQHVRASFKSNNKNSKIKTTNRKQISRQTIMINSALINRKAALIDFKS